MLNTCGRRARKCLRRCDKWHLSLIQYTGVSYDRIVLNLLDSWTRYKGQKIENNPCPRRCAPWSRALSALALQKEAFGISFCPASAKRTRPAGFPCGRRLHRRAARGPSGPCRYPCLPPRPKHAVGPSCGVWRGEGVCCWKQPRNLVKRPSKTKLCIMCGRVE